MLGCFLQCFLVVLVSALGARRQCDDWALAASAPRMPL